MSGQNGALMDDAVGERHIDENEGPYRSLIDLSPLPTVIHDGQIVLYANPAAAASFGYTTTEAWVGASVIARVDSSSMPRAAERVAALLRGESVPPLVERFLRSDGSAFDGEAFASPTVWRGSPAIHVIIRDLTEARAAEAALRQSEEDYRQLFEMSPDPMVVHDGQTSLMVNRAARVFLAVPDDGDADAEQSIWSVIPEDQRASIASRLQEMGRTGRHSVPLTIQIRALDGEMKEAEITSAPTRWERRPAVATVFRDLTERRRAERALTDIMERYAAVVAHAPMGMHFYQVDSEGQLVFTGANKAADDMLGVDHGTLVGKTIEQAWPGLVGTDVIDGYRAAALEGSSYERRSVEYDDGVVSGAFETHAFQIGAHACAAMFWDIADRVRNETELAQHRDHLEELVAQRTQALEQAQRDVDAVTIAAARAVELRDPYTAGHQRRVAELSYRIALELGLGEEVAGHVRVAGLTHDIGKLSIPGEILSKPGTLSTIEYELVKGHAVAACEILNGGDIGWPLAEIVSQHHERMDGSGYPAGLVGDDILLEARILAVADVIEAMSSHRPYRPSLGMPAAIDEITRFSGKLYDADVAAACSRVLDSGFAFTDED